MSPRLRALARFVALRGLVPLAAYFALAQWLARGDAATVLLGATGGASIVSVLAMLVLLVLRVYTAVLFAPWLAYRLVQLARSEGPPVAPRGKERSE